MDRKTLETEARAMGLKIVPMSGPERIAMLLEGGPLTRVQVAAALDMPLSTTAVYLSHLRLHGVADTRSRLWRLVNGDKAVPARCDARYGSRASGGGDWEARLTETWSERKARRDEARPAR